MRRSPFLHSVVVAGTEAEGDFMVAEEGSTAAEEGSTAAEVDSTAAEQGSMVAVGDSTPA